MQNPRNSLLGSIRNTYNKNYGEVFTYLGKHFIPLRKLRKSEFAKLRTDVDLGFTKYTWNSKFPYDYNEFYSAMDDSEADIFLCQENSKLYVPCSNELFLLEE